MLRGHQDLPAGLSERVSTPTKKYLNSIDIFPTQHLLDSIHIPDLVMATNTTLDNKLAFLHTQIRNLSAPLSPSPDWQFTGLSSNARVQLAEKHVNTALYQCGKLSKSSDILTVDTDRLREQ
jgi:hypothetical protein